MDSATLQEIKRKYELKRKKAFQDLESRKKVLYDKFPRLYAIDAELSKASLLTAMNILKKQNPPISITDLENLSEKLKQEKISILKKDCKSPDYLEPTFSCEKCKQ